MRVRCKFRGLDKVFVPAYNSPDPLPMAICVSATAVGGHHGLFDQLEELGKINWLVKHVACSGCSGFFVLWVVPATRDNQIHHLRPYLFEAPAQCQALHARHPQIQ
jgi:hypothetical protein